MMAKIYNIHIDGKSHMLMIPSRISKHMAFYDIMEAEISREEVMVCIAHG